MHPHDASCLDEEALAALRTLTKEPRVVAIGETGLDFYRNLSAPVLQRKAFQEQLALASEVELPVVIHARQAQEETFAIVRDWAEGQPEARKPFGVLHCFAGDSALAQAYVELGFMISIAGNVTYPNAKKLQTAAASAPLESMLIETDCPFLAPQSQRGRRCEPAHLRQTVEFVAGLRGSSVDEVASATAANARRLYRL
jgi:TatD DNase family protein